MTATLAMFLDLAVVPPAGLLLKIIHLYLTEGVLDSRPDLTAVNDSGRSTSVFTFGTFRADVRTGELRKDGRKVSLGTGTRRSGLGGAHLGDAFVVLAGEVENDAE